MSMMLRRRGVMDAFGRVISLAPMVASTGSVANADSTTASPGVPSGVSNGSLVVAFAWALWSQTATAPTTAAMTGPTGWVVDDVANVALTGDGIYVAIFRAHKYATGSDTGTYTFNFGAVGSESTAGGSGAFCRRIVGGPTSGNPWSDTLQSVSRTTEGTSLSMTAFTPGGDNTLLLGCMTVGNPGATVWPSGWTNDVHDVSDGTFDGGYTTQTSAASTGTLAWTIPSGDGIAVVSSIRAQTLPLPIMAYGFDEGSGTTAADASGNLHTATVYGWTTGHTSYGAYSASGAAAKTDEGTTLLPTSVTAYTAMAWVDPKANDSADLVGFYSNSGNYEDWFGIATDSSGNWKYWLELADGSTWQPSLSSPATTWAHLAVAVSATSVVFYVNGVAIDTHAHSGFYKPGDMNFLSMGGVAIWSQVGSGVMDDVRLFDTALSAADIATYMGTPVTSGSPLPAPIAAYNFDEGSGVTAADSSGYGRTATIVQWGPGHTSNGAYSDGSSSAAIYTGPLLTAPTEFSMMAWIHPDGPSGTPDLMGTWNAANTAYVGIYQSSSGKVRLFVSDSSGEQDSAEVALTDNTWTHVTIVVSGSGGTLYLNGVSAATVSRSGSFDEQSGWSVGGHSSKAAGIYDDFRLFDVALTADQITRFMDIPVAANLAPSITTFTLTNVYAGTVFSQTLVATNSPTSWAVSAGALPTGLSLNTSTGAITGTPSDSSGTSFSFSVTATNSSGTSLAKTYVGSVATLPSPLVAWAADEGSGTAVADASGHGHAGVASATGWVTGHGTHAYAASGDSTHPGVQSTGTTLMSGSQTVTIMAWVKAVNLTGSGDLLEIKDSSSSNEYVTIYRPSGETSLQAETKDTAGSTVDAGPTTVADMSASWHHIAVTRSTTRLSLYLDGALISQGTVSGSGTLGTIQDLFAGGTDTKFNQGAVNDVRMYDTALALSDIQYLMSTPVVVPLPDPIAAYAFDENGGALGADATGNGHTAEITAWATGHTNSAADGDVSHSAITSSSTFITSPTAVTIMGWHYPTHRTANYNVGALAANNVGTDGFVALYWADTTHLAALVQNSAGTQVAATSSVAVSLNAWSHFAITVDSTTVTLYINGVATGSNTRSGSIASSLSYLEFGGLGSLSQYNMGRIDDFRVFDTALTAKAIASYMDTPVADTLPAPVAAWAFDENAGVISGDSTGNGRTYSFHSGQDWSTGKTGSGLLAGPTPGDVASACFPFTPTSAMATSLSVSMWFKTTSWTTSTSFCPFWLLNLSSQSGVQGAIRGTGGGLAAVVAETSVAQTSSWPSGLDPSTTWTHYAVSCDSVSGMSVYLNGVLVASDPSFSYSGVIDHFMVYGDAIVDDLRIFDVALTESQINSFMAIPVASVAYVPTGPTIASTGSFGHISSGTVAVPVPSGVVDGSLVIIAGHAHWATSTIPTASAINLPSGFQIGPLNAFYETNDSVSDMVFYAYKYASGSDSGTYDITFNSVGGVAVDSTYPLAAAARILGITSGNPFVDTPHASDGTGISTVSVSTFTPTEDRSLLMAIAGAQWGSISPTGPTGWTKSIDSVSDVDTELWYAQQTTAAATGTLTWSYGQNIDGLNLLVATLRQPLLVTVPNTSNDYVLSNLVSGSTDVTLSKPVNTANGDMLVALVGARNNGPTSEPSGWTRIDTTSMLAEGALGIYSMVVTDASSLPSSWAWGFGDTRNFGIVVRAVGAKTVTGLASNYGSAGGVSPHGIPFSLTGTMPTGGAAMLLLGSFWDGGGFSASSTQPVGFNMIAENETTTDRRQGSIWATTDNTKLPVSVDFQQLAGGSMYQGYGGGLIMLSPEV